MDLRKAILEYLVTLPTKEPRQHYGMNNEDDARQESQEMAEYLIRQDLVKIIKDYDDYHRVVLEDHIKLGDR